MIQIYQKKQKEAGKKHSSKKSKKLKILESQEGKRVCKNKYQNVRR